MESDEGSGMGHTLWRNYDSSSGRWASPDPYGGSMTVSDPQSFNRYTYVNDDPVNSRSR
jgi:RHS repeat-associated protein